ncbi:hypothetical protein L1887_29543 [Cichorium endivia]|nr:hypothetical protein L1887_29543 [Cichorium endivia]
MCVIVGCWWRFAVGWLLVFATAFFVMEKAFFFFLIYDCFQHVWKLSRVRKTEKGFCTKPFFRFKYSIHFRPTQNHQF